MIQLTDTQKKGLGIVRIVAGVDMLIFGLMKFGATPEMKAMVGGAGAALGLGFIPSNIWFWIAVAGEILAGLMLVCGKHAKYGATLALIIMIFAINAKGINPNALFIVFASVAVLILGSGYRVFNKGKFQKKGSCCSSHDKSCCGKKNTCSLCGNNPCTCK